MFERYTERARRVIFYARFEASQFGSPYIETEHVLLALLREDRFLAKQLFSAGITPDELRKEVESQLPHNRPTSTSVDLPLTNECKRVLAYAAEEAARLQNRNIGAEHLLLGLLREAGSLAATILARHGLKIENLRASLEAEPHDPEQAGGLTGGVVQSGMSPLRLVDISFVYGGTEVARAGFGFGVHLPRVGEIILLPGDANSTCYKVSEVVWHYEVAPEQEREGHNKPAQLRRLANIVVQLELKQPRA